MDDAEEAVALDVLAPSSRDFFQLLLAANARAFGGLAIPAWVQLDCATLPTAMVGFARRAGALEPALVDDLARAAGIDRPADDALVPLAEFCALPTPVPGHVVGISLFSLVPGLGLRAKALGLLVQQATTQTGVTQIDNAALATHCRLGGLRVVQVGVRVHSRPGTTLVYALRPPSSAVLVDIARGACRRVPFAGPTRRLARDEVRAGDVLVDVVGDHAIVAA
jgi:hypothetical protein